MCERGCVAPDYTRVKVAGVTEVLPPSHRGNYTPDAALCKLLSARRVSLVQRNPLGFGSGR